MSQVITLNSPACIGILMLVSDKPGITTSEIAERGGWSVFHIRNCLRFLRKHGKIKSERPIANGDCHWWLGQQEEKIRSTKRRDPKAAPQRISSVFAMGAA